MYLGVDYYPEMWDSSEMEKDLDNIADLGCNVIRIGEFCWHMEEPQEGKYDFSYLDRVTESAKKRNLKVIMGTPTATIPAWLAKKHPSILSEFENGSKRAFGGRHVFCLNSPIMYEYTEKIVTRLAEHFKDESAVAAWQIDNELGHEGSDICYCDNCKRAFRSYLAEKFNGDIERLNETYGTVFWSQQYNSFDEIPLPAPTITTHNPALRLDWERFRSKSVADFCDFQIGILKKIIPGAVVTHDFPGGGLTKHTDYSRVAEKLSVVSYNNYPVWGGQPRPISPSDIAFGLDFIRGLRGESFWVTEAIIGAQGHDITGYTPRPGQAVMWSYQAIAHGCCAVIFFRYRGATKGAEQFCRGILDADNIKRRRYFEVKSFFKDAKRLAPAAEHPIESEAAIVYDYDSLAALRIQRLSTVLDVPGEAARIYSRFFSRNINADVIPADRDFSRYKLLIVPQMIVHKEKFYKRITDFAACGGTVVLTYLTSVKDCDNNLVFGKPIPLGFSETLGVTVTETESLQQGQRFPVTGKGIMSGTDGFGSVFREMLETDGCEVLFSYADSFYKDFAAVTRKKTGKGVIYYIGCGLDEETEAALYDTVISDSGLSGEITEPGVECRIIGKESDALRMIINHNGFEARYKNRVLAPFETVISKITE